ncbi:hypothetical protein CAPTEDRAFT_162465 [Capitella teleta]|uniref:Succinate--CoA ligase [GDP-forming] subunit beta, mitochondrial n=1 Tax=Capitella teleta TaxID=283909 RepID=R7T482_CAPTE|nr:hypothetical protein CAPTEDRAFT_162465 [Capitella teleta]|eukprot:ELT87747.1 hypothetical protein CAPTEDRAFT_162465 [Capitella teleta]
MDQNGINVQKFRMAGSAEEAKGITREFKCDEYVVKAQILAGGRGKGVFDNGFKGGVHLTKDASKVAGLVESMLGHKLKTKQTGPDGVMVSKVMVAKALDISRETYFAILMDRGYAGPVMVGSPAGGMDIEEVADKTPELIFKEGIDITKGVTDEQATTMAKNLQFEGARLTEAAEQIKALYKLFLKVDATQVEINPFGETPQGEVVCFDAKINFDDNAEYRQKEIFALNDTTESDPREVKAASHNLNYIGMEGNIGCLVNGAGLAMATMDIVKLHGGEPANFLDCGGGVTEEQVFHAFKILTSDPQVKAILVNVFGGIVDCRTIANGVVNAANDLDLKIPVVCRLEGNNVTEAREILSNSGLAITAAADFEDVASKAVASLSL